ncbi:putative oxidoreductase [Acetobacter orientalis]|uniref:Putative oxidoreductase n=1 Tax=Acetobacter orientalis TaxID=146474 RepID=A0A2Z5ZJG2_9PROT|nr:putative oxidoreductase [Acetobacter orientalis]
MPEKGRQNTGVKTQKVKTQQGARLATHCIERASVQRGRYPTPYRIKGGVGASV